MNYEELSPELKALLSNTPVLTESDINELAEANRALARDPDFIADCLKGDFVNDILSAMDEQGMNKNQLAVKWGKTRQHVSQILDKEKSKNFTIDTIVSLSMTLGLVPQRIVLRKMTQDSMAVRMNRIRPAIEEDLWQKWCVPNECGCTAHYIAERSADEGSAEAATEDMAA
jgi:plasmid maintenance system antidote protein VapI